LSSGGLADKLHHIFDKPGRHPSVLGLVKIYGSQQKAYEAIEAATLAVVNAKRIVGEFEITVTIRGQMITVRGIVINGVMRIGTAL